MLLFTQLNCFTQTNKAAHFLQKELSGALSIPQGGSLHQRERMVTVTDKNERAVTFVVETLE